MFLPASGLCLGEKLTHAEWHLPAVWATSSVISQLCMMEKEYPLSPSYGSREKKFDSNHVFSFSVKVTDTHTLF